MKVFGLTIGSDAGGGPALVVGGHPSVDLLPPEVRITRRSRGIRRGVIALAVVIIVGAAATGVLAKVNSVSAAALLVAEEARTQLLLDRQSEFFEITAVQSEIEERTAARQVITGSEIDWRAIIAEVRGTLPEGAVLTNIAVDGASPMAPYAQASGPLQGARVATVSFTITSPAIFSVADITDKLAALPGFVDSQVPSAAAVEPGAEASFVVHLDQGAFANRYPSEEATAEAAPSDSRESSDGSAAAPAVEGESN